MLTNNKIGLKYSTNSSVFSIRTVELFDDFFCEHSFTALIKPSLVSEDLTFSKYWCTGPTPDHMRS